MTNVTTFCFRCRITEAVVDMDVHNDGVTMTMRCGYRMRKYWKADV